MTMSEHAAQTADDGRNAAFGAAYATGSQKPGAALDEVAANTALAVKIAAF